MRYRTIVFLHIPAVSVSTYKHCPLDLQSRHDSGYAFKHRDSIIQSRTICRI